MFPWCFMRWFLCPISAYIRACWCHIQVLLSGKPWTTLIYAGDLPSEDFKDAFPTGSHWRSATNGWLSGPQSEIDIMCHVGNWEDRRVQVASTNRGYLHVWLDIWTSEQAATPKQKNIYGELLYREHEPCLSVAGPSGPCRFYDEALSCVAQKSGPTNVLKNI